MLIPSEMTAGNHRCVIDVDHSDTTRSGTATNREIAQAVHEVLLACVNRDGIGGISKNIGR